MCTAYIDSCVTMWCVWAWCLLDTHRYVWNVILSFQNNHCVSGCSLGLVCYWNVRSGHVIHELEVEVERSGVGVVKVNCSESYVVALLADSSVSVWDRSKGTLTNVIRMVRDEYILVCRGQAGKNRLLAALPNIFSFFFFCREDTHTILLFSVIRTLRLLYW